MRFLTAVFFIATTSLSALELSWPTETDVFYKNRPVEDFIQPTVSGEIKSGLFGDVRSSGYKFHEGIDIKAFKKDRKGEAKDEIYAAMDGIVVLVNTVAGNSGYGRYIVLEHPTADVPVYTLYGHLSKIDEAVKSGKAVKSGSLLGVMGRSANYAIPKERAHLHFEVGLMLTDTFDTWYAKQKFPNKNFYGNYNGMNLYGFDPLEFFEKARDKKFTTFQKHIESIPVAFVLRVYTKKTPDFVRRYPMLCDNEGSNIGWDIHFSWYGLPLKFERIKEPRAGAREGECEIVKYNPEDLKRHCRKHIALDKKGNLVPTEMLKELLQKLF